MQEEKRNIGLIKRIRGPIIDVAFEEGCLPQINNALKIIDRDKG
ncbi:MAG TPA: hypothetical protein ENG55_03260, partial [Candidatus Omnitrophica bacterium]|nr:hypothetical protein [Candidatus Omnitrophota bacterium]